MKKAEIIAARVALRIRPPSSKEISDGFESVIHYTEQPQQIILGHEKIYDFDYVFNHKSTQKEVYQSCASDLVDKVLAGYDATIFAYGQTGSGKTYTMGTNYKNHNGFKESCGIVPRILEDVFKAKEKYGSSDIQVAFTFVEIYNEALKDLMAPNAHQHKNLRDNPSALKLAGIEEFTLNSFEEALQLFEEGCTRRVQEKTFGNQYSSRSHAIFTLTIVRYNENSEAVASKLNLVDLAGSEACSKNLSSNSRYKEGININLSLLTLGKVIRALRDTSNALSGHVPYRDSLLTRLLKDSLCSNCFILMVACVNPAKNCLAETANTLNYATTVCCIKTRPFMNTSTAKKILRTPLHVLPPTPAWFKQGLNITLATPTIRPTPAEKFHPCRMTVATMRREVQDSGCSPMFKEQLQSRAFFNTPYHHSNRPMFQNLNDDKLEPPPVKGTQKTLDEYFMTPANCIDKENIPVQGVHVRGPVKKNLSAVRPAPSFLSPMPSQNFLCFTPLRDRTNTHDSPALNTRSCSKKRSFASTEDQTNTYNSPALNTRSCSKKHSFAITEDETLKNEGSMPCSLSEEAVILPIPLFELSDEIFDLPSTKKKYNLRDRRTIHCNKFFPELFFPKRNTKARRKTRSRKTEFGNGFLKTKQNNAKFVQQHTHEKEILKLLNAGSQKDLQTLPCIGPKTAYIICTWRKLKGSFQDIKDLQQVTGLQQNFFTKFAKTNLIPC